MLHNRSCIAVSILVIGIGIAGAGCQSDDTDDDQAQLLALLRDEPLQQVPPIQVAHAAATARAASLAAPSGPPIGAWKFDDCSPLQTDLRDDLGSTTTAFRAVATACTEGVQGQGIAFAHKEDLVYVPDQPTFTFEDGVTIAGWFKPTTTTGTRTLIRKRDRGTSSFALVLNSGKFQFVANLGGHAASVTAPAKAKAGAFQHVAASYDGHLLRLYIDGVQVKTASASGTVPIGAGPLLIGNDGSERRFDGTVDTVTFATHALDPGEVLQLNCLPVSPTLAVTPDVLPPVPVGVPVTVDLAMTNHNPPGACAPIAFDVFAIAGGLLFDPALSTPVKSAPIASGQTGHLTFTVTAPGAAEPGASDILLLTSETTTGFFDFRNLRFTVAPSVGCHVDAAHELMIRNRLVVDDLVRTAFAAGSTDPRNGAWTLKHLIEDMAPSAAAAPAMVEAMLATFDAPGTINSFTVAPRSGMKNLIVSNWPRTPDGQLDLAQAPVRLQAIVNRFDLRNLASGDAGEGRFVFGFNGPSGQPLQATLILEYKLPAISDADVLDWANSFHALGAVPFGEAYNTALQAITDRFTRRGARPGRPNGSAINSVRTNEISLGDNGIWELRQFGLSPATGLLEPQAVDLTPDGAFNNSPALAQYINANQSAIIAEKHVVPAVFAGQPFQGAAIFNDLTTWFAPGVDPEARHHFALNTCNGCHSAQETGVPFLQISPRAPGTEAGLSGFLIGTTIADPVTGTTRVFDDLGRRKKDLEAIVCPGSAALTGASLRTGIQRVH